MRIFIKIAIFLALILFAIYIYAKYVIDSLTIDFKLFSVELKTLSLSSFWEGKAYTRIGSLVCIDNKSSQTLKFSSLTYQVFYMGNLVAVSSDIEENKKKIVLLNNKNTCFVTKSDVFVNPANIKLLADIKTGKSVILDYIVYFKFFFINISKKGSVTV